MPNTPRNGLKHSLHVRLPIGLHNKLVDTAVAENVSLNLLVASATGYTLTDDTDAEPSHRSSGSASEMDLLLR